jgi:hypothetical protein
MMGYARNGDYGKSRNIVAALTILQVKPSTVGAK